MAEGRETKPLKPNRRSHQEDGERVTGSALVGALAGSSVDERVAWERAMLVAASLMAAAFLPVLALRRHR
jgi:hypothetical protein